MKTFSEGKPITITLGPDIRFLWPYVFEKRVNDEGEDKYEVLIQIPHTNKKMIALFEDAIDEAIKRGFSGELSDKSTFKKGTKEAALKTPLKDGEDKRDTEYGALFEGYIYCTAKTQRKPVVIDENGQQILDPEEFYPGAIGAVSVTVFPYNNRAQGIGVQLNHIMKLHDGERIGGGVITVEDAFADYLKKKGNNSRARDGENRRPARNHNRINRDSDDPIFD
jgi:hypothetical protein